MNRGQRPFKLSRGVVVLLWLAALVLLVSGLGTAVVQRTQEARVLEAAREMLEAHDWRGWMIPRLNGEFRLQKPPLAYWAAAGGFKLLGMSDFAGRLPFAVAGWLTLAIVYRFARALLDQRFAFLSAAMLLTSFMFFRHFRLAETDALAALFVTAAIYSIWKGAGEQRRPRDVVWYQLAGAATGLAVLSKGPPGAFPLIFLLAWVIVERKWEALARFLISGALLTALIIGGSWYLYIYSSPHWHIVIEELRVLAGGEDHRRAFYLYFPQLLVVTAPWTGLFVLGLIGSIRNWRGDPTGRMILIWCATILIPLCVVRNRQNHYLLPITPALAMLCAYAVHRALVGDERERRVVQAVVVATIALSLPAPIAVYLAARRERGFLQHVDLATITVLVAALCATLSIGRRYGWIAAFRTYLVGVAFAFAVVFGRWWPSLPIVTHRTVAADLLGHFGDRPFTFYGRDPSFPLLWNLRRIVPTSPDLRSLEERLDRAAETVVIAQTKNNRPPPQIPPRLQEWREYPTGDEDMVFRIYILPPRSLAQ